MPINKEALLAGRDAEAEFARLTGTRLQPNSGAGKIHKLDTDGGEVLFSVKSAPTATSIRVELAWLLEMDKHARGPAGSDRTPALALTAKDWNDYLVAFRLSDALRLARGEISITSSGPTREEQRRADASVPLLLR